MTFTGIFLLHFEDLLQEHSVFAVGEPCIQFLGLLQQPLLLRIIKPIHLQVCISIKWSPLIWFVSLLLRFFLHRLCVHADQRLATFRLLIKGQVNFSPENNLNTLKCAMWVQLIHKGTLWEKNKEVKPLTLYFDTFPAISKSF